MITADSPDQRLHFYSSTTTGDTGLSNNNNNTTTSNNNNNNNDTLLVKQAAGGQGTAELAASTESLVPTGQPGQFYEPDPWYTKIQDPTGQHRLSGMLGASSSPNMYSVSG